MRYRRRVRREGLELAPHLHSEALDPAANSFVLSAIDAIHFHPMAGREPTQRTADNTYTTPSNGTSVSAQNGQSHARHALGELV